MIGVRVRVLNEGDLRVNWVFLYGEKVNGDDDKKVFAIVIVVVNVRLEMSEVEDDDEEEMVVCEPYPPYQW